MKVHLKRSLREGNAKLTLEHRFSCQVNSQRDPSKIEVKKPEKNHSQFKADGPLISTIDSLAMIDVRPLINLNREKVFDESPPKKNCVELSLARDLSNTVVSRREKNRENHVLFDLIYD